LIRSLSTIPQLRLHNQFLTRTRHRHPSDVVAWLGAVQAQEFGPAKWALGLRLPARSSDAAVQEAFDAGQILRTHVMRPTWHFVTSLDIRWMLELTAPRVHQTLSHYRRKLGLDDRVCKRATDVFERALDEPLTRVELGSRLARAGIATKGIPLAMLTIYAELEGVICSGPRRGKHQTYARLADRAPDAQRLPRDEALAELTRRYFRSHGPATIRDFVWWSGLTTPDTKRGLEMIGAQPHPIDGCTYWQVDGGSRPASAGASLHLLPIYDEYLVSYRDRIAVPHGPTKVPSGSRGSVLFQHALVIAGQVAGTWRTGHTTDAQSIEVFPLRKLSRIERGWLDTAVARYSRFRGAPIPVSISR
jgi:Winged helix DNA-binding domain